MDREETDREFVIIDDDPGTDFVIVEEEPSDAESRRDDEIVAVPDADARYPGLVPVESLTETGFVIVDEPVAETDFVIVEDEREDDILPAGDTALVPADEADLVPSDDDGPSDAATDPFTPDAFRPNRGN